MAAPQLRFKEFDNQWDKTTINDQAQTVTSGSRDWAQYYSESGDKFIRMTNLVRDGIYLDLSDLKFVQLPKDSNEGKRTSLKFGDILISITAELGKLGWIPEGLGTAYINQHTALVRMKDSVDSKFVAYSLSTEKYNNKLNSLNDSGAKAGLNLGTIRNFELIVPPKAEQTKIASFLSAVDEKISQLTQKHELLSQYKQGMMQKLFSQQIRFKADDGSEFGEFKQKCIKDLNLYISDGNYGELYPTASQFETVGIPFIRANNIKNLRITNDDMRFINEDLNGVLVSGHLKENDILVTTRGDIGMLALVDKQHENSNINAQICLLRVLNSKELDSLYLLYFLHSSFGQKQFKELQTGTALKQLPKKNLNQIIVLIPCLEEQTKNANFLSAIDQKIEVVAQQIEQAKQWKKGLLQQMFV